ncbi:MAG: hypothetical protein QXJ02_03370 [Candidatus Bathyarchaeia archaeon]
MSDSERRNLLSIGAFLLIIVVTILLYQPLQIIRDWVLTIPMVIFLSGCWLLVLAGMRASNPQKYERGAFSTLAFGLLLAAVGGAWFLYDYGWYYSVVLVLATLAILATAAATKRK